MGRANLSAFLWVQNLLDSDRVQSVWRYTGLAGDDGFLASEGGALLRADETAALIYQQRVNLPGNYGIPRLTRLGLRLNF